MAKKPKSTVEYRAVAELKELERNPRTITKGDFEKLKTSIKDNPDYFEARPLVLSNRTGELVVLAGNQRLKAAKALGLTEVPTVLLEGLTEEREKEIIIRDNVENGDWDFDVLANEWDTDQLMDWGVKEIKPYKQIEEVEPASVDQENTYSIVGDIYKLGRGDFQNAKELAIYGLDEGSYDQSDGDETNDAQYACYSRDGGYFTDSRKLSNVWFFEKPTHSKDHPTMKPIGLCAKGILVMSRPGDIVFDPFLGSGSTLIAAEQTGRRCYGCEIDPKYVDVIRKRYWKQVTGDEEGWQEGTPAVKEVA